jgi:transcriptional regulator with XRE-family HTH domain
LSIGANLKRLRTDKGMSQVELAGAVNVTQSMIAQIERGTKALTMELGREISETLGVSINELLEEL